MLNENFTRSGIATSIAARNWRNSNQEMMQWDFRKLTPVVRRGMSRSEARFKQAEFVLSSRHPDIKNHICTTASSRALHQHFTSLLLSRHMSLSIWNIPVTPIQCARSASGPHPSCGSPQWSQNGRTAVLHFALALVWMEGVQIFFSCVCYSGNIEKNFWE